MLIVYIAIIVIIPILAQCIRTVIESQVKPQGFISVIPGVFSLTYSENRGVAFGLFQDGTLVFSITTSIVIIILSILLFKNYKKSKLLSVAAALIIGGGLGNLFERIFLGYVVDYLSLSFFSPICNFADYCITAGTICLIVYLLFFSDFLKDDKKKKMAKAAAADQGDVNISTGDNSNTEKSAAAISTEDNTNTDSHCEARAPFSAENSNEDKTTTDQKGSDDEQA